jgi:hypothetical protein
MFLFPVGYLLFDAAVTEFMPVCSEQFADSFRGEPLFLRTGLVRFKVPVNLFACFPGYYSRELVYLSFLR